MSFVRHFTQPVGLGWYGDAPLALVALALVALALVAFGN